MQLEGIVVVVAVVDKMLGVVVVVAVEPVWKEPSLERFPITSVSIQRERIAHPIEWVGP